MNRTLLFTTLMLCAAAASAAEPATAPPTAGGNAARSESARAELAELRAQMKELSGKMAKLSTELGDVGPRAYAFRYLGDPDRAVIGVVLSPEAKGARISAVTPDGPAARAGLHDGDVIVAINGERFANPTDPQDGLREARELLGDLKDGEEVRIAYERGAKAQADIVLKAGRREAYNWPQLILGDAEHPLPKDFEKSIRVEVERARDIAKSVDHERLRADVERATADARRALGDKERFRVDVERAQRDAQSAMRRMMPWWGLNLAPVNADLGRYFGTDKGALVVSADEASPSGLRGGDVITEVAGESVNRPEDALRALRDQPPGKDVAFKVLRDRKTLALNVKAPEYKSIFSAMPLPPPPPEPPAAAVPPPSVTPPPSPPAAPAAPAAPTPPVAPAETSAYRDTGS